MKVGLLALQGDIPEHRAAIAPLLPKGDLLLVRTPEDLARVGALLLPGGESTTIGQLLDRSGLWGPVSDRVREGLPVLATCAGLILLAKELEPSRGGRDPPTWGLLDVRLRRNDYGRQGESFEGPVRFEGIRGGPFPGVFIRAPRIQRVGPTAKVIADRGDEIVGVRQGAIFGLTFHPELSGDRRIHEYFLREARRMG